MHTQRHLTMSLPVYISLALFTLHSSFLPLPPSFRLMRCSSQSGNEGTREFFCPLSFPSFSNLPFPPPSLSPSITLFSSFPPPPYFFLCLLHVSFLHLPLYFLYHCQWADTSRGDICWLAATSKMLGSHCNGATHPPTHTWYKIKHNYSSESVYTTNVDELMRSILWCSYAYKRWRLLREVIIVYCYHYSMKAQKLGESLVSSSLCLPLPLRLSLSLTVMTVSQTHCDTEHNMCSLYPSVPISPPLSAAPPLPLILCLSLLPSIMFLLLTGKQKKACP